MSSRPKTGPELKADQLSPTELMILVLISHEGADTLYALHRETLHSAGALVPALAKLKAKGLLHAEVAGPRNRQQFRVPAGALKEIEEQWRSSAQTHIMDCDAVLKLCKAAELFDIQEAIQYAHSAAELRATELWKHYKNRAGQVEAPEVNPFSYGSYRNVRRFYQLQAEEQILRAVEAALLTDA